MKQQAPTPTYCVMHFCPWLDNCKDDPLAHGAAVVVNLSADCTAPQVCMQGGIHPDFTGQTYLDILAAAKEGAPRIHVHAFSPLEVRQQCSLCMSAACVLVRCSTYWHHNCQVFP